MSNLCDSEDLEERLMELPETAIERMYIEQYLAEKGSSLHSLKKLPQEQAKKLMIEACRFATLKLADVEAKSHFKKELHGT